MKNFEEFVKHIVIKWKLEKKTIYGLGIPANRVIGDLAEKYVAGKISKLNPIYSVFFPNGSQTPSDLYSVARRNGYWHIMLIQVKCSTVKTDIYELNKIEVEQFASLGKFVKAEILISPLLELYRDKPIIISIGYAGVYSNQLTKPARHQLMTTKSYKMFRMNSGKLNLESIKDVIETTHNLVY